MLLLRSANPFNQCIRVIVLPAMLVGGALILFTWSKKFVDGGNRVVSERQSTMMYEVSGRSVEEPSRRYSSSDEMRYILYGIGDQFSPNDQQLVDYTRSHISQQSLTRPRQLGSQRKDSSQEGQSAFVDKLLSGRRDGFFVECGAADGETFSNSLFFELQRNWTGVLIEANPDYHRALLNKNRRAYVLRSCLSTERRPATVRFRRQGVLGGIVDTALQARLSFVSDKTNHDVEVNCFPLNSIMTALNVSHVDYLSLDVEGPELEILRTVDWTRLRIDVITVEYRIALGKRNNGIAKSATLKKLNDTRQFFRDTGIYNEVALLPTGDEANGLDVVFSRV